METLSIFSHIVKSVIVFFKYSLLIMSLVTTKNNGHKLSDHNNILTCEIDYYFLIITFHKSQMH